MGDKHLSKQKVNLLPGDLQMAGLIEAILYTDKNDMRQSLNLQMKGTERVNEDKIKYIISSISFLLPLVLRAHL